MDSKLLPYIFFVNKSSCTKLLVKQKKILCAQPFYLEYMGSTKRHSFEWSEYVPNTMLNENRRLSNENPFHMSILVAGKFVV